MSTRRIMATVLVALIPGLAALCYYFGLSYLPRLAFAMTLGLAVEAAALALQGRPVRSALSDGSTLVTCTLLTLAIPPPGSGSNLTLSGSDPLFSGSDLLVANAADDWGILAIAVIAAVTLGKHVYGGLGGNPFNPAIVGYAVALVSFPAAFAHWPVPTDGVTGATALTALRHREGQTVSEIWSLESGFGAIGGYGWEWINAAFLAGGLFLAARRLIAWRVPVALLATLGVLAALGYDSGSSRSLGSPAFHWFSGGTCLAACFFATDPVTHPVTHRGQVLFGILVAAVAFVVRGFGNYPDGLAFGILLANAATPYLDRRLVAAHG